MVDPGGASGGRDPGHPADTTDEDDEARGQMALGVWTSGVRCVLVYVVAPILGGTAGLLGGFGVVLQILGTVTCCTGARTLWRSHHPARIPYALVAMIVFAATVSAISVHRQ